VDVYELFGPTPAQNFNPTPQFAPEVPQFLPRAPRLAPTAAAGDVPDWLIAKVDDYITDHFYALEAQVHRMQQQIGDLALQTQKREDKVSECLHQVKNIIEIQYAETKKGMGRDNEMRSLAQQFEDLKRVALVEHKTSMEQLKSDLTNFRHELEDHASQVMQDTVEKLKKRDDATYRFESDLMNIKKSFSSLRLEFQKHKKAQDFKNTSTSLFFFKAFDMKPDERKRFVRTLTEQEEKNRGAVEKADGELRDHEKTMH
jgi:hypothetical protein